MELHKKRSASHALDDEQIIALFFARDEKAIKETDSKYGKYLYVIAHNILCDDLDCEECINDTYLGVWNAIPPSKPNVLKAFLTVIARRTAIRRYHARLKKGAVPSEMTVSLSELEPFVTGDGDVSAEFDAMRLGAVLGDFLRSLSERRQFIFMSRYYAYEPINVIARKLGLSRSSINKELAAIRTALMQKLESEGYYL